MLAGLLRSSAFCSQITFPVEASIRMYDGASISGAAITGIGIDTNSRNVIIPHSSFFIIVLKAISPRSNSIPINMFLLL